jgi:hypothetical protein
VRELIASTERLCADVRAAVRDAARLQAQAQALLRTAPRLPLGPVGPPAPAVTARPWWDGRGGR